MLAKVVAQLEKSLPARNLGWVFPDETTASLLLDGVGNLVFSYRPPQPVFYIEQDRLRGEAGSPFQRYLYGRLRGNLVKIEQLKLDRVIALHFEATSGFIDQPPARLLFEVTGRNANLLILEAGEGFGGKVSLAAREITSTRNRFRTVRSGGMYTPPPPYEKLDPRKLDAEAASVLATKPIAQWRTYIDGLGPLLTSEIARRAGMRIDVEPAQDLPKALEALLSVVKEPTVSEGVLKGGASEAAKAEKSAALRKILREPLEKRVLLISNQLGDVARAETGLDAAFKERAEADLLMAYAHSVPLGASSANLTAFDNSAELRIELEPHLSAVQNAEKRYSRARRREDVYERLAERESALKSELSVAEQRLSQLGSAEITELESLLKDLESEKPEKSMYGTRFTSPSGYEVLVGRNNKENAVLTHRIGKSLDYWFHVQGYSGSHVLVKTKAKDLDLPDILYAARIAAANSKARGSSNVPVDYTRIKFVWRPKGAPAGKVHYTDQKTVYVDGTLPQ